MNRIAIVGGGFSGAALVVELLRSSERPVEIVWLERSGAFGAGLAYGTDDPNHLLNVPADRMSALRHAPSHFADWLVARGEVKRAEVSKFFAPRRLYRAYLHDLIEEARRSPRHPDSTLDRRAEEVTSLSPDAIVTGSGQRIPVDRVVLATGYLPESTFGSDLAVAFAPDRWPNTPVCEIVLIGSGLTAIDAALSALERYPNARVTAISRHGMLPKPFAFATPGDIGPPPESCAREGFKELRRKAAASNWNEAFAWMRSHWDKVWANSTPRQQQQFLRHLRPRFDAWRHRMPPASADTIAQFQRLGRFQVLAGRVLTVDGRIVRYWSDGVEKEQPADFVIDCSGSSLAWPSSRDPLASFLISEGHALPGPHGMGIAVSDRHQVTSKIGPSPWLYALGPMLRGQRWETTAVAEIREQAGVLAEHLLETTRPSLGDGYVGAEVHVLNRVQ